MSDIVILARAVKISCKKIRYLKLKGDRRIAYKDNGAIDILKSTLLFAISPVVSNGYKLCNICGIVKTEPFFYKNRRVCKKCQSEKMKNTTRAKCKKNGAPYPGDFRPGTCMYCGAVYPEKKFQFRKDTMSFAKICNECRWSRQNKHLHYKRKLEREKTDIKTRLNKLMRNRIRKALKSNSISKNGASWCSLVDYSVQDLERALKKSLLKLNKTQSAKYTWRDFIEAKLHIDHIIPISQFSFKSKSDTEFKRCWSLDNLQLLPAFDNISKSDKCESFQTAF